jgi:hypothetical protein
MWDGHVNKMIACHHAWERRRECCGAFYCASCLLKHRSKDHAAAIPVTQKEVAFTILSSTLSIVAEHARWDAGFIQMIRNRHVPDDNPNITTKIESTRRLNSNLNISSLPSSGCRRSCGLKR